MPDKIDASPTKRHKKYKTGAGQSSSTTGDGAVKPSLTHSVPPYRLQTDIDGFLHALQGLAPGKDPFANGIELRRFAAITRMQQKIVKEDEKEEEEEKEEQKAVVTR